MDELTVPVSSNTEQPETGRLLPNFDYIRRQIPILDVARELGIHPVGLTGATWTTARCFRPENHKGGYDTNPSLNFQTKKNTYICFACDDGTHSNIDLVMTVEHCTLREAGRWFDEHFPGIPRIKARGKRTGRNVFDFRAGVDEFTCGDDLVKAGIVPHLTESELRVFTVLNAFRDGDNISRPSYETIKQRTGIRSNHTVSRAIRQLEKLNVVDVKRGWARNRTGGREQNQYAFTFNDPDLFDLLTGRAEAETVGLSAHRDALKTGRLSAV